jgi:RNA polymerase sigma-70 factor (ECF subfamily)
VNAGVICGIRSRPHGIKAPERHDVPEAELKKMYSDGGGKRAAALNPIRGADRILRFFAGIARKNPALALITARLATVNGSAGFVMRENDGSIDTMAIEHYNGSIVAIYLTRNPRKLQHIRF